MLIAAARAAQILVRTVLQILVLGVGVDGGHQALDDPELVVEHLGQRAKAVRRARRVGDDVLAAVVLVVVDTEHDRDVLIGGRRGDDDLLGAGIQVTLGLGGTGEDAGRLHHHVDTQITPGQRRRSLFDLQRLDLGGTDDDGVLTLQTDLLGVAAQDRVELEQMRQTGVVGEVVDRDDLDVGALTFGLLRRQCPIEVAPDTAEAVDADSDGHLSLLLVALLPATSLVV